VGGIHPVDGNKKTLKVNLNDGNTIFARINFKTISSLTLNNLTLMFDEFCTDHLYQVNFLENEFSTCLVNIKATKNRTAVKTSIDFDYDDYIH
jgi:hypothetical protein